jgi:multidrug efflux pump subunit AcrA (membrane-fusion protein)
MNIFQKIYVFFKSFILKIPFVGSILGLIKKILSKIWPALDFVLKLAWRFIVPVALVGMLVAPILLALIPPTKTVSAATVSPVTKQDVTKKITIQGTTQNAFSYDLPVYQDSTIKEILVKPGDKVVEGQVLANLEPIAETTVRSTSIENQIAGFQNDIANNNKALEDLQNVNFATQKNLNTNAKDRTTEINELNQQRVDQINKLAAQKVQYTNEKAALDAQIASLTDVKDINDAVSQYQTKLDALRLQLTGLQTSNTGNTLQTQIDTANQTISTTQNSLNTLNSAVNSAQANKDNACKVTAPATAPASQSSCDTATIALTTAQADQNKANTTLNTQTNTINNLNNQINNNATNNNANLNSVQSQINDYQNKINQLGSLGIYNPNAATSNAITDAAKLSRVQTIISTLQSDSNQRKTWLQAIADDTTVKAFDTQILAKQKVIDELGTSQALTQTTLAQTTSNLLQKNSTSALSLQNANKSLQDTITDIQNQAKTHTVTAKQAGIISVVNFRKGLPITAKAVEFTVISPSYRLMFSLSADSRAQVKPGMKVLPDKYPNLSNVVITDANLSPDPTTATATAATVVNYTLYADLPDSTEYQYVAGQTVNLDVVIAEAKNVLTIPSSSVDNGDVYVGVDPVYPDPNATAQGGQTNNLLSGIQIPGITGGQGGNRGGGRGGQGGGGNFGGGQGGAGGQGGQPNSTATSSIAGGGNGGGRRSRQAPPTFKSAKLSTVKTGLDDGKNIEVTDTGVQEGEYVFTIFPTTDANKKAINVIDNNQGVSVTSQAARGQGGGNGGQGGGRRNRNNQSSATDGSANPNSPAPATNPTSDAAAPQTPAPSPTPDVNQPKPADSPKN